MGTRDISTPPPLRDNVCYDVIVIGAGPAGSAAARALASWGHSVALLTGLPSRLPPLAESLPPSILKPLAVLGLEHAVEGAGFLRTTGNTASWAGGPLRATRFDDIEPGFQVRRDELDALLLRAAVDAGAHAIHAAARTVDIEPAERGGPGVVAWHGPGGEGTLRGRWILDCTGRVGVLAKQGFRRRHPGPATLALSAVWQSARWPLDDPSHTLVESYLDGWAWSVPVTPELRHVAVMIDPRKTAFVRNGLESAYLAELAKAAHHSALLGSARLVSTPWACTATPHGASRFGGPGHLLVGDAGSFIDPLSSFGVKKALASAWLAAVVVNTALRNPAMEEAALALFEEREALAYSGYSALAATYYEKAAVHHEHPFWTTRAEASVHPDEGNAPAPVDSESVLRDPRMPAALQYLRTAPALRLRFADGVTRERRPVVQGQEVVLAEQLVSRTVPGGIGAVRGVGLPQLVDLLAHHEQVPDVYDAWEREIGPVQIEDLLAALSALVAMELVEPEVGAG